MARDQTYRSEAFFSEVSIVATERGPIEIARAGTGPCVLAIHGIPGSWRQCFSLSEDLRDRYTVVAPSRPGYGRTPLSTGRTAVEQARAYAAALDAMGIERAVVLGASGGGPSAIAFAEAFPDRTAGLVLVCAMESVGIPVPAAIRYLFVPRGVGEVVSAITRALAPRKLGDPRAIERSIDKMFTRDEQARIHADEAIRDSLVTFAWTHQEAPAGLAGMRNDMAQVRAAKAAGARALSVKAPTLIQHGGSDDVCPVGLAETHHRLIEGSTLTIYPDAGHTFFLTNRAAVTAELRAFIEAVV